MPLSSLNCFPKHTCFTSGKLLQSGLEHWNWWCGCFWRVRKWDHHWFNPCSTTWSKSWEMPRRSKAEYAACVLPGVPGSDIDSRQRSTCSVFFVTLSIQYHNYQTVTLKDATPADPTLKEAQRFAATFHRGLWLMDRSCQVKEILDRVLQLKKFSVPLFQEPTIGWPWVWKRVPGNSQCKQGHVQ